MREEWGAREGMRLRRATASRPNPVEWEAAHVLSGFCSTLYFFPSCYYCTELPGRFLLVVGAGASLLVSPTALTATPVYPWKTRGKGHSFLESGIIN